MRTGESDGARRSAIEAARETVRRMANPGGCAWHEAQTHESLLPFLIEETAEFVDAVERGLSADEVAGELGDVLYQVLFHTAIAARDSEGYDFDTVAAALDEKLRARHPHVFGDRGYMTVDELNAEWERLKEDAAGQRRGSRGALDGIPAGMPTLARAAKVVERLKRAQLLDVRSAGSPELRGDAPRSEAIHAEGEAETEPRPGLESVNEASLGDEILALVIKANAAGLDADRALRRATAKLSEECMRNAPDA